MDALEQRIANLSPAKRKLLAARLAGANIAEAGAAPAPVVPPVRQHAGPAVPHVASIAQRRLWFMQTFVGESAVYHNAHGIRFRGPVDPSLLHKCLQQIVDRHETLRMRFVDGMSDSDAAPTTVVSTTIAMDMPIVDLGGLPPSERDAQCKSRITEFGWKPFNLATGPLIRSTLLRLSDNEHLLIVIVHHIVSDRWSVGILLGELAALYNAGALRQLPSLPVSYTDYAAREQMRQAEPAMAAHLGYWRQLLLDRPRPLDLPADHPRPAIPTYVGGVDACTIPVELVDAVSGFGRRHGATPFMTFLAAFLVFVSRSSATDDIVIGTLLAGRHTVETERLIGLFVNILPLRARVESAEPFAELLGRVKSAVLGMLAHQQTPFDRLVEELRIERDQSRHPLFGVVFNFHNVPFSPQWPAGVDAQLEEINLGHSRFDLMLTMRPAPDGAMRCEFEFSADLFERATIERMGRHFESLLRAISGSAAHPVGSLSLMDDAERRLVLEEWSCPATDRTTPALCVHQMFERQAALTPQAEALVCGHERLTYQEFDQRANRLARRLRALGAGPDRLVGVCLRRTAQLPIALVAILKSGAAYVPLDPAYPRQRLENMLEDSRASILLTESALGGLFPSVPGRTLLKIDEDAAAIERESLLPLEPVATLSNLAYVIFTSGSTGRPKGVAIEHRGAAALMHWARRTIPASQLAGMLFSTSICFDLSVFELQVTLCTGGKLILVQNVLELPECPARNEVTFINTVPSAMTELARVGGVPPSVLAIGLAGEALPAALARRCYEFPTVRDVYNFYGPTEDTVYSTAGVVARDCHSAPNIGRPIGGTRALVLDAQMQPVPIGINGELYLGGNKLAREYLHRPDLTAERFIANPHGAPGERLYRTGDLCRWNGDGTLQFLGRADFQIKFRGFRIELGEIETSLGRHPAVRQCLAIVAGEGTDQRLVAYVVCDAKPPVSAEELREFLAAQLPAYMVPASFIFLETMPTTSSGKVDRRALPAPGPAGISAAPSFVAPQSPVQEQLAAIWRDVLRRDRVGVTDSFFDLGGHSLLAVRLMHEIERKLNCRLPLARLFAAPTIAQLADLLNPARQARPADSEILVALQTAGENPPLFCVSGAGGDAFAFRQLARLLPKNQPLYALQYEEADTRRYTARKVEEMAAGFIAHIRRVCPQGPYRVAGYSLGGVIAYEIARQLAGRVEFLALFDSFAPGTLRKRPVRQQLSTYAQGLIALGARGCIAYARERMRRFTAMATSTSSDATRREGQSPEVWALVQTMRNARAAAVRSGQRYRPLPYSGTVTLFRSMIRSAWLDYFIEHPANGWSELSADVRVRPIPGTHFTMWHEPNVIVFARELSDCLQSAVLRADPANAELLEHSPSARSP